MHDEYNRVLTNSGARIAVSRTCSLTDSRREGRCVLYELQQHLQINGIPQFLQPRGRTREMTVIMIIRAFPMPVTARCVASPPMAEPRPDTDQSASAIFRLSVQTIGPRPKSYHSNICANSGPVEVAGDVDIQTHRTLRGNIKRSATSFTKRVTRPT